MAYKVSYKVVSEQGEALKKTAKDIDNYINQLDQITSKLGNDELFQSVREQLKKFRQQLEEERTVLNLAGQVITEVIQSYTGVEKKSVSKVDKAKAHNRDFYKRPVAVASAGGASAGDASAGAVASGGSVNVSVAASSVTNTTVIHNTTNVVNSSPAPSVGATTSIPVTPVASSGGGATAGAGIGEGVAAAAAGALGAVAAVVGAEAVTKKKTKSEVKDNIVGGDVIDGTYVES